MGAPLTNIFPPIPGGEPGERIMLFGLICISLLQLYVLCVFTWGAHKLREEVQALQQQVFEMSTAFDNLKAAVAAQTSLDASAVTLITGIAEQLKSVTSDPQVQALADQLTAGAKPLAEAVAANTPASGQASASSSGAPTPQPGPAA